LGLSAALQRLALGERALVQVPLELLQVAADGSGEQRGGLFADSSGSTTRHRLVRGERS
jgi:hypothetical protein